MDSSKVFVSVIIPNYNGIKHLKTCLSSLERQSFKNFEVIVVDNGSTDRSVKYILENFPWVRVLKVNQNLGWDGGNNLGLKIATGSLIAFLNNDTEVAENWLKELVRAISAAKDVGTCASKVLYFDKKEVLENTGLHLSLYGDAWPRGNREVDRFQYDDEIDNFFYADGSSLFVKREVINEVGDFDEMLFAGYDDVDYCWRIRLRGYRIVYAPSAVIFHKLGSTTRALPSTQNHLRLIRNRLRVMMKCLSFPYVVPTLLIRIFKDFLVSLAISVKHNTPMFILCMIKGILWNLYVLKDTIQKRNLIQKQKKVSDASIREKMQRCILTSKERDWIKGIRGI